MALNPVLKEPETSDPSTAIGSSSELYSSYVNPQWVKLLSVLRMNTHYIRCSGTELFTADGRRILDFLSGYCVHNTGHNHPDIIAALQAELARSGPGMLQSHAPGLAGQLAEELCTRAGDHLHKAFFCSSGSEGVEAVIKFSRAHTRRSGLLYASGAFHGLTCGALSLMGDPFWREGFGPLLPGAEEVPFGDLRALEEKLASRRFAALLLEPVQAEAGIRIATREYLAGAQALCRKHGTVFALDEVQTGLGRTGKFLAAHHYGVQPDMVVLAKALSGGLVPSAAVLMTDAIYGSVFGSLQRAIVHTSTFSENALALRAGLATLAVIDREQLATRARETGDYLRQQLRDALASYEMVKEIRGLGLLSGIEFQAPKQLRLRAAFEAFRRIHGGLFGQMLVMRLYNDKGMLTQICGNNFMVLKVAPPLGVSPAQVDEFAAAIREVVHTVHASSTFWSDALSLGRRAIGI
ncbi:MAG TPA: aspartate aminotransferase family protein [Terriglobales bacterium]|nr:aspartate aminotransferase family protein [Terriglobales bacterium]